MLIIFFTISCILLLLNFLLTGSLLRYRKRLHEEKRKISHHPISTSLLPELHSCFAITKFGYSQECEVSIINRASNIPGTTTDAEAWILAVLSKHSQNIFEFGTCSGKTTYLMARNAHRDAKITTLTLGPEQHNLYTASKKDSSEAYKDAIDESAFSEFAYTGTDMEFKITQLFGDSKQFDETPFLGKCDLIFIDGSHAYSYVKSDSEKAMRMLSPKGIIVWHDYFNSSSTRDVYRYLNELKMQLPLRHISGTAMIMYRAD